MIYEFTSNYNEELAQYIDGLFSKDKADKLPRQTRLEASDRLIESYVKHTGERPPSAQLGRLATLILRDELIDDKRLNKMTVEEYPLLSDRQGERRADMEREVKAGVVMYDITGNRTGYKTSFTEDNDGVMKKTRFPIL